MKKLLLIILFIGFGLNSFAQDYVIKNKSNYIEITRKSDGKLLMFKAKKDIRYTPEDNGKISIKANKYTYFKKKNPEDFEDENGVVYTIVTLDTFFDTESAKTKAGSGGSGTALTTAQLSAINAIPNKLGKTDKANQSSIDAGTVDDKYINSELLKSNLDTKVDKVVGKKLTTNDFTNYYKNKIASKLDKPVNQQVGKIAVVNATGDNIDWVDNTTFDNAKEWQPSSTYKANEIFFFEAVNGQPDAVGKVLKAPHGYFGRYLSNYTTPATFNASEQAKIYTVSNGGSLFRDPVTDIVKLKQVKNPSNGETRQVGTGTQNNTVFYTFNTLATIGENANDGTVGKWIQTADPTKRILALSNSLLGYENYNAGFTLTGDLEDYQYKQYTTQNAGVTITHDDPAPSSGGALEIVGAYRLYTGDDFINVNSESPYRAVLKAKTTLSSSKFSNNYLGIVCYDNDKNAINHSSVNYNATKLTTLANPVANGDITIELTDATGWNGLAANRDGVNLWKLQSNGEYAYKSATGKKYDELGYTKDNALNLIASATGNTVTLKYPWNLGSFPAGTKIAPNIDGGTYKYYIVGVDVPNDGKYHTYKSLWFTGEGKPQDNHGNDNAGSHAVRNGTSFVKLLGLFNYREIAGSNVHAKLSVIGFEKGNSSNVAVVKRVKFIGSSNTFATIPTTTVGGDAVVVGDYARLLVDDGANLAGIYYYHDDSTYKFGYAVPTNVLELTDLEMLDNFEVKKGISSPKQIFDLISLSTPKISDLEILDKLEVKQGLISPKQINSLLNDQRKFAPDNATAQATTYAKDVLLFIGNGGGIWRNETGGDAVWSPTTWNAKDSHNVLVEPYSNPLHTMYDKSGNVSYQNLDTWYNTKVKPSSSIWASNITTLKAGDQFVQIRHSDSKRFLFEVKGNWVDGTSTGATWDVTEEARYNTLSEDTAPLIKHLLAVKSFTGATFPANIDKDDYVFNTDAKTVYKSGGGGMFSTVDVLHFADYMELDIKDSDNYRWNKSLNTFEALDDNLLRELVANVTGLNETSSYNIPLLSGTVQDLVNKYEKLEFELIMTGFGTKYRSFVTVSTRTFIGSRNSLIVSSSSTNNKFIQIRGNSGSDNFIKFSSSSVTLHEVRVYGVKKQYTVSKPIELAGIKLKKITGILATNGEVSINPSLPAGSKIISVTGKVLFDSSYSVTLGFNRPDNLYMSWVYWSQDTNNIYFGTSAGYSSAVNGKQFEAIVTYE